jgi:hypothetical protein
MSRHSLASARCVTWSASTPLVDGASWFVVVVLIEGGGAGFRFERACLLLLHAAGYARARFARRRAIIKTRSRTKHNHPPHHTCTASAKMGRRIPSSSENSIVTMASAPPAAAASILFRFVQLVF